MFARSLRRFVTPVALFLAFTFSNRALAQGNLKVVGWNVESSDSNPQTLAQRIRIFQGVDIWGLSEVQSDAVAEILELAAEDGENADFSRIVGTTGNADRLVITYKVQSSSITYVECVSLRRSS